MRFIALVDRQPAVVAIEAALDAVGRCECWRDHPECIGCLGSAAPRQHVVGHATASSRTAGVRVATLPRVAGHEATRRRGVLVRYSLGPVVADAVAIIAVGALIRRREVMVDPAIRIHGTGLAPGKATVEGL